MAEADKDQAATETPAVTEATAAPVEQTSASATPATTTTEQASQATPTPSAVSAEDASAAVKDAAAEAPKPEEKVEEKAEAKPEGEHKPSLLSEAGKKKEAAEKAAKEAKAKEEAKPEAKTEEKVEAKEEPLPPIEYKPFKTPKNLTLEEEALGKYTEVLGKHRAPQELGQELIDMYTAEVQRNVERAQKLQWDVWNKTQEDWTQKAQSDPEFGGNRMATSLRRAGAVIEQYGGNPEQIKELREALTYTGAGNHPALVRLFNNIGKALGEGTPVPAPTPNYAPQPKPGRAARLYNGS